MVCILIYYIDIYSILVFFFLFKGILKMIGILIVCMFYINVSNLFYNNIYDVILYK